MLDRWGKQLRNQTYLQLRDIKRLRIDMKEYFQRFSQDRRDKKVFLVNDGGGRWTESFLNDWLQKNYKFLGFDKVIEEHTFEYNELKRKMGFQGFPDFLVCIKNQILRLEIECFPCLYHHDSEYCEIVLCYEINEEVDLSKKWYGLKEILGYEDIINLSEVIDYMFLKYPDFKQEVEAKINFEWSMETE